MYVLQHLLLCVYVQKPGVDLLLEQFVGQDSGFGGVSVLKQRAATLGLELTENFKAVDVVAVSGDAKLRDKLPAR